MADGFLGRWSRRKIEIGEGKPLSEPPAKDPTQPQAMETSLAPVTNKAAPVVAAEAELPTLADAEQLTKDSDFKPFVARGVSPQVKNAAMKKLFSDPHFNVMDGLDIYIDDYSLPDPLPQSVIRQMASAQFLKLFDDEESQQLAPAGAASAGLASSKSGAEDVMPSTAAASPQPPEPKEQSS
ncbi:MAG: DUF3306 domain-containing protein [Burkholderiaceae bacterium]